MNSASEIRYKTGNSIEKPRPKLVSPLKCCAAAAHRTQSLSQVRAWRWNLADRMHGILTSWQYWSDSSPIRELKSASFPNIPHFKYGNFCCERDVHINFKWAACRPALPNLQSKKTCTPSNFGCAHHTCTWLNDQGEYLDCQVCHCNTTTLANQCFEFFCKDGFIMASSHAHHLSSYTSTDHCHNQLSKFELAGMMDVCIHSGANIDRGNFQNMLMSLYCPDGAHVELDVRVQKQSR